MSIDKSLRRKNQLEKMESSFSVGIREKRLPPGVERSPHHGPFHSRIRESATGKMSPASLKLCALLHKPERAEREIHIDYLGFTIPNKFVVGYGLDYDDDYRHLPYVAVLDETRIGTHG